MRKVELVWNGKTAPVCVDYGPVSVKPADDPSATKRPCFKNSTVWRAAAPDKSSGMVRIRGLNVSRRARRGGLRTDTAEAS